MCRLFRCLRCLITVLALVGAAVCQSDSGNAPQTWTRISEILIRPKPEGGGSTPNAAELGAAKSRAEQTHRVIQSGTPFALAAFISSDGPTARKGGDVGYFKPGDLADQFDTVLSSLRLFEVSEPIRTKQGYVLLQVTDRRIATENPTTETIKLEKELSQPYADKIRPVILDTWHKVMPKQARSGKAKGVLIIGLTIVHTGQVALLEVEESSKDESLDRAAKTAIL